jgi:uncharacterized membrane protein
MCTFPWNIFQAWVVALFSKTVAVYIFRFHRFASRHTIRGGQ